MQSDVNYLRAARIVSEDADALTIEVRKDNHGPPDLYRGDPWVGHGRVRTRRRQPLTRAMAALADRTSRRQSGIQVSPALAVLGSADDKLQIVLAGGATHIVIIG